MRTLLAAALLATSTVVATAAADAATFGFSFTAPTSSFGSPGDTYVGIGSIEADETGANAWQVTHVTGSVSIAGYPEYTYGIEGGKGRIVGDGLGNYASPGLAMFGSGPSFYFRPNKDGATYEINLGEIGAPAGTLTLTLGSSAVPEPAAWALMIGGLGAAGGALRRRRGATGLATA